MKLDTIQHPKFRELKELLDLPDYAVAGILELLWHVAARYHDDGGIGRWKDTQLARAIDFRGDSMHLVRALISAGWLDEAALPARLTVHDWLTHCPFDVWRRVRVRVEWHPHTVEPWLKAAYAKAVSERAAMADDVGGRSQEGRGWPAVRRRILERDRRQCRYCRLPARTVDHLQPRSRGGSDEESNLAAACVVCNCNKGARTPEEAGMRLLEVSIGR
jgi:5-methylcytosine-specific restriction endonuclease McrA